MRLVSVRSAGVRRAHTPSFPPPREAPNGYRYFIILPLLPHHPQHQPQTITTTHNTNHPPTTHYDHHQPRPSHTVHCCYIRIIRRTPGTPNAERRLIIITAVVIRRTPGTPNAERRLIIITAVVIRRTPGTPNAERHSPLQ
jgi:hypothetical protein